LKPRGAQRTALRNSATENGLLVVAAQRRADSPETRMSDDQFNEAKRLIDGGMKMRAAARQVGASHATLLRRLRKDAAKSAPEQPQPETEADPWRTIRSYENESRKRLGLPPLTDAEWADAKQKMKDCQLNPNVNWPAWKPQQ
jgi:hypothetical protein